MKAAHRNLIRFLIGQLVLLMALVACGITTEQPSNERETTAISPDSVAALLELAVLSEQPVASQYLITAGERLLEQAQASRAREVLSQVAPAQSLPAGLRLRLAAALAELALLTDDPAGALAWLQGDLAASIDQQPPELQRRFGEVQGRVLLASRLYPDAAVTLINLDTTGTGTDRQPLHDLIWQALQNLSAPQLTRLAGDADSYQLRGWVELARAMRASQHSIVDQIDSISRWENVWNRHSAAQALPSQLSKLDEVWNRRPRHVALLLPLQDQIGRAVQEGFLSAYYQSIESDTAVPLISVYDTTGVAEIRGIYETAVESGAELVIGPLNKELVRQLDNLSSMPVPTLALNYTDFADRNSDRFYQFGLAPEDEIRLAANQAWVSGYRNAAIVAPGNIDYARLQQAFAGIWENLGGNVVSTIRFAGEGEYADAIKQLLAIDASEDRAARLEALLPRNSVEFTPSRRGDIDFIFLMANPRQGRQINPTLAFYFAGDIPVYALSAINDGTNNQLANQDLNGIIFTDAPWVLDQQDPLKETVNLNLRNTQGPLQRLRALGIDSFRIYARLGQLANGELTNFNGATGALTMNQNGIVERVPLTAVFRDGSAVLVETTDALALQ
jgi:outer membrane PBP1 activator LpoA protein